MEVVEFEASLTKTTTKSAPRVTAYLPNENKKNIAIIIFPGGGYGHLAEHEGKGYAEYLGNQGISSFVVEYRLGTQGFHHPAMLEDGLAALEFVRLNLKSMGLADVKVGVMGSSAGGHLASHCLTAFKDYEGPVSLRPDFGILCYPVITMAGPFHHKGSKNNLLGEKMGEEEADSFSTQWLVNEETPPCFIWHTWEDTDVPPENSMFFSDALRANEIRYECHIYENGKHGLGLNTDFDWGADCVRWLKRFE